MEEAKGEAADTSGNALDVDKVLDQLIKGVKIRKSKFGGALEIVVDDEALEKGGIKSGEDIISLARALADKLSNCLEKIEHPAAMWRHYRKAESIDDLSQPVQDYLKTAFFVGMASMIEVLSQIDKFGDGAPIRAHIWQMACDYVLDTAKDALDQIHKSR